LLIGWRVGEGSLEHVARLAGAPSVLERAGERQAGRRRDSHVAGECNRLAQMLGGVRLTRECLRST
jgi:hypothetical protein